MSKKVLWERLSNSDMQEWLNCSKDFLTAVDEFIDLTPINSRASGKQKILRFLFMDARTAAYDICVLAESLLNNDRHIYSRAMEAANRLILENTIDYFYISESDDSVAERRIDFMLIANSKGEDQKKKQKDFEQKYGKLKGDYWSGKSREEKINQGILKCPKYNDQQSFVTIVPIFKNLNERVHGNSMVGLYWSFDKHGTYNDEYRGQVAMGLLNVTTFYFLSDAYCKFTGRGSEVERFVFYESYVLKLLTPES